MKTIPVISLLAVALGLAGCGSISGVELRISSYPTYTYPTRYTAYTYRPRYYIPGYIARVCEPRWHRVVCFDRWIPPHYGY